MSDFDIKLAELAAMADAPTWLIRGAARETARETARGSRETARETARRSRETAAEDIAIEYDRYRELHPPTRRSYPNIADLWRKASRCERRAAGTKGDYAAHLYHGETPCEASTVMNSLMTSVCRYRRHYGPLPDPAPSATETIPRILVPR